MREARTILQLLRERGKKRLPLERVYRLLYNPDLYLMAYGKMYRNHGAMTKGTTEETADGMRKRQNGDDHRGHTTGTVSMEACSANIHPQKGWSKTPIRHPILVG